jgi:hypothetical protein
MARIGEAGLQVYGVAESLQGAWQIARTLMTKTVEPDEPRVVRRVCQQGRKGGSSIPQPACCEVLEDEIDRQRLLPKRRGAGHLQRTVRRDLVRDSGVRSASAKEGALKARRAEAAAVACRG